MRMNFPAEFMEQSRRLLGENDAVFFEKALHGEAPVSVRMNPDKAPRVPEEGTVVPWCSTGYYIGRRPAFTFDPLFHAGCYYVQEASSMFVEQALRQYLRTPALVLDLCAAPGGKSTLACSLLSEDDLLVSNEVIRSRSQVLMENLVKWGRPNVIVTNNDPADFQAAGVMFDVILADVPCSGEGMFRKDPSAVEEWSPENVENCVLRQRRILRDIWPCLKPGGLLVYSTCTYNRKENEDNVAWIVSELGADVLGLNVKEEWNITGNLAGHDFPVYRFLPHRTLGEGFFLAVLRKKTDETMLEPVKNTSAKMKKKKGSKTDKQGMFPVDTLHSWIKNEERYAWRLENGRLGAFPLRYDTVYEALKKELKILHAGIVLGDVKGKDFQPSHSLAMSSAFQKENFPHAELTYRQAIDYLRKEAIVLSPDVPRGYVLVTYRSMPLGFVKNIGNRANNLYPQEWRIRSTYLSDGVVSVL